MKVLIANIEDVMREAAARWTLLTYFILSTIFIATFAIAVNLDVVDGAIAGAKLFGNEIEGRGANLEQVVLIFEGGFSGFLFIISTLMAVFATAHLVPRMQDKGTVDLYLSRPVSRVRLLLSRYFAGLLLAGSNIFYLLISMWLIVVWKTHVVHARFLAAGLILLFVVAVLLAFAFLIGVATSSTAVSIMTTYAVLLFGIPLTFHKHWSAIVSKDWQAWAIDGLYWIMPKTLELATGVIAFVGEHEAPREVAVTYATYLSTGLFGLACLIYASWLFQRKEF